MFSGDGLTRVIGRDNLIFAPWVPYLILADGTLAKVAFIFFPLFILNCVSKDIPFDRLFICTQAEESIEFINSVNFLNIFFSWGWKQYSFKKEEKQTEQTEETKEKEDTTEENNEQPNN